MTISNPKVRYSSFDYTYLFTGRLAGLPTLLFPDGAFWKLFTGLLAGLLTLLFPAGTFWKLLLAGAGYDGVGLGL